MGACVSTKNHNHNHNHNHNQNPSPMKQFPQQKPPIINAKPHSNPPASFGSKEETFFDSQAWLESDCDDDFMSVNGEFTPSRGSTPVHHNFCAGNKQHVSLFPYPDTPEKKPRLSDLFKESLRSADSYDHDHAFEDEDGYVEKKTKRERLGCFRSLVPSRSSSTNGRKTMTPSPGPKPVVG